LIVVATTIGLNLYLLIDGIAVRADRSCSSVWPLVRPNGGM
jgi:hypothetical protein